MISKSGSIERIEIDLGAGGRVGWPLEGLVERDFITEEAAIAEEEALVLSAAGVVEAVIAGGGCIAGKAGLEDFVPVAVDVADPLVAVESAPLEVADVVVEVFEE